jgi:hypothetical protein
VDDLLRLLELVRRELGAEDAHVRLGGRRDDDPRVVEHALRPACHLVVRLAAAPADREVVERRLHELADAFSSTVVQAIESVEPTWSRGTSAHAHGSVPALVQTLADLRDATGAVVALVVDRQSPVIWGCSEPALGLRDRPAARVLAIALGELRKQGVDPVQAASSHEPSAASLRLEVVAARETGSASLELARRALQAAERSQPGGAARLAATARALLLLDGQPDAPARMPEGDEPGLASKGLLGLYVVALVFVRPFSPLRVEGVLRRALPILERNVAELPPLDPEPNEGRVLPMMLTRHP